VRAIIWWVHQSNHSQDVKDECLNKIFETVNYINISPEYTKFIADRYIREHIVSKKNDNNKSKVGG
jgi:hypothetical protein